MVEYIKHFLNTWGQNNTIAAIIGSLLTLIITLIIFFSRQIGRFIFFMFKWFWATINKRGKDYIFEQAYLTWIINQHRYLGLLPARVVTARWGEEGRYVDLEKVYVSLHVFSAQGGDKNSTETSTGDPSSWHKHPWLYTVLRKNLWYYILVSIPLILYIIFGSFTSIFNSTPFSQFLALIFFMLLCIPIVFIRWRASGEEETYQLGDLAFAIDSHKQLVIRGDPGSGKTTLLRYLAVTCARALRNSKKHGDAPDLVKKRLLWTTRPFPIVVTLRRHSNVALWSEEKRFIDLFSEEMPVELRKRRPEGFFERKLAKGNCLILLDAFDELGSPEARVAMAHRIEDFLNIYDHSRNRVIITTRIVGYEGQLDRYGFQIRTVQHLEAGEIRALIKQRYEAIAVSETAGWSPHDAASIKQDIRRRSERLIKKVESTPQLAQLATNPLLLSLIVLVHRVKLELPEERVQLYRECVEILTEQWQSFKRAESNLQSSSQEELNFSQKLVLLQALALNMQQQREEEDRQILLPQSQAQEIIANKLPDILGSQLPVDKDKRREVCRQKAAAWVKGIQVESGILVEQGLDNAGNPLIGFSHLTFQEYLAALAIYETPSLQPLLIGHLLQPAWREVVLLYVALTSDATSIIEQLLDAPQQPRGTLLAGFCLAEKVKHVKNEVLHLALTKLKAGFEQADDSTVQTFGQALAAVGGTEVTTFMRGQLHSTMPAKRLEAIKALGQTKSANPQIKDVQEDLVKLLETPNDVTLMIETREALAQIGDPRFTSKEPVLVSIPQQTARIASSPKGRKELLASPEWIGAKTLRERVSLIARVFDYWYFREFHHLRKKLPDRHSFATSKYPVTNMEYARFVEATEHRTPNYWIEGTYPTEKATHPVTGITIEDAEAYCKWLSKETGEIYRLPTEWEWEQAATGPQGLQYSWGDQFDKNKCNTNEAAIGKTTPVGSYLAGTNQFGITDMVGNVWEITQGSTPSSLIVGGGVGGTIAGAAFGGFFVSLVRILFLSNKDLPTLSILLVGGLLFGLIIAFFVLGVIFITHLFIYLSPFISVFIRSKVKPLKQEVFSIAGGFGGGFLVTVLSLGCLLILGNTFPFLSGGWALGVSLILTILLELMALSSLKDVEAGLFTGVLRGGAFDTPSDQATCFFRKGYSEADNNVGFRCVKEI
jgi:energy-coupling factor transporter ATP-binding protein EcfA2